MSAEQIEAAINAVSAREGLAEETRSAVIDQLRDAQAQLQNQVAAEAATEAFAKSLVTAPAQTEALLRELDEPTPEAPTAASLGIYRNTPVDEVESVRAFERFELRPGVSSSVPSSDEPLSASTRS